MQQKKYTAFLSINACFTTVLYLELISNLGKAYFYESRIKTEITPFGGQLY
jgi:hypothetical protein